MVRYPVSKKTWKQTLLFSLTFAVIFSLIAIAQIAFIQFRAYEEEVAVLKRAAGEVSDDIYPGRWDPKGYNQSDLQQTDYLIVTSNGLLVDFQGFVQGLIAQAKPVTEDINERPSLIETEIGENWLAAGRRLKDGLVVAGISNPRRLKDPESILRTSLGKFGENMDDALKVKPRAIDAEVDYAIVDEFGDLRGVETGFPLKIKLTTPPDFKVTGWYQQVIDGRSYIVYAKPISDKSGTIVGAILAFGDISGQLQVLDKQKRFNFAVAFVAWFVTAVGAAVYNIVNQAGRRQQEVSLEEALRTGESQTVEFKEGIDNPDKVRELARVMAAFANVNAGNIFVGVRDSPVEVVGVQAVTAKELDEFQKRIRDIAVQLVRPPVRVRVTYLDYHRRKVARIFVPRGSAPVHFVDNVPYIRDMTSVSKAGPDELHIIFRSFARMGA